ncbi:MAG TPA: 6-bladed beta-propeller [Terriglobales bacterium]|nr:6-bladed beta-propeller [Terriglobales bacterium]
MDRLSGGITERHPYQMAIDSQSRILVTDSGRAVVHVFDTRQKKRWQFRGGSQHHLRAPAYIAVDADDNIYVTDLWQSAVLVFEPSGRFKQMIGSGVFNVPSGIWVDKHNQRLYVADWWKNEILMFDLEGKLLRAFGTRGTGPGQLRGPRDLVVHGDTLVVLDADNSRFQVFDLQGNFRGMWPYGANRTPVAFTFDPADNLYYIDLDSGGLVAMAPQGKVLARFDAQRSFGQWIPRPSQPNFMCIATDEGGDILALRPTFRLEVIKLVSDAARQP